MMQSANGGKQVSKEKGEDQDMEVEIYLQEDFEATHHNITFPCQRINEERAFKLLAICLFLSVTSST